MRAKELMIGDWVYSTFCDKPCKVIGIEQYESEYVNVKVTNVTGAKDINSLYFIPLTAEILEKNGFEEIKWNKFGDESSEGNPTNIFRCELETKCLMIKVEVGIYKPNFVNISAPDDCGGNVEISSICKIDGSDIMLHELQHALRLCGIDKEIVL